MRGHIQKTGKHSYRIRLHIGKNKYKTFLVKGTYRDAERERARAVHELETGTFVNPTKMTVAEFLEKFAESYRHSVAAKTYERDFEIIRRHLIPALGHYPIAKLTGLDISAYYSRALHTGRCDGKGGLNAQTVRSYHRILHMALEAGVRTRILARNVAKDIDPPKAVHREMLVWNEAQIRAGFELFRGTRLYAPVVVLGTTGLRRGELLGLKWPDIDLIAARLSVARSLEQTNAGLAFKDPKTRRSRRTIDLWPLTVEVLRHHKAEQARIRLAAGPAWQDHDLVFPAPDGRPYRPSLLTNAFWQKLRRCATVTQIRLHDLRHSHATQLLRANVHVKVVSERLGHSSVSITLDRYSHVLPGMQRDAIAGLDAALRSAGDDAK